MKQIAGCLFAILLAVMGLPFLFVTGSPPGTTAHGCELTSASGDIPAEIEPILATIRQRESSGDYQAQAPGSTASGAYQFIHTTWANYRGYTEAWLAPPEVQDAKATEAITGILDANNGDIDAVPVIWYIGWYPAPDDPAWDTVPGQAAGNVLTPRQYRDEWMDTYRQHINEDTGEDENTDDDDASCVTDQAEGEVLDGGWAYPGPVDLFATAPVDAPHHDYPAWDWAIDQGTPIYAIRGGTVISAKESLVNCFDDDNSGCQPCGTGVTLEDDTQTRWTYCHGSQLHIAEGDTVAAGTLILSSGNTGRSTGPHLHLAIRTPDGIARCPQPLLQTLRDQGTGFDPHDLPSTGCMY